MRYFTTARGRLAATAVYTSTSGFGEAQVTKYTYDELDRLKWVVSPSGDTTRYWYDDLGRVKYKYQPDLDTLSYAYDNIGNVRFTQTQEQANANRLSFNQYDDLNRIVVIGEARIARDSGSAGANGKSGRGALFSVPNLNRLTDVVTPTTLRYGAGSKLTTNPTLWMDPATVGGDTIPALWGFPYVVEDYCPLPENTHLRERGNPVAPYMRHPAWSFQPDTITVAQTFDFEHLARYPEFIRTVVAYDSFPASSGPVWSAIPPKADWDSLCPRGVLRNGRGSEVAVAYREHSGEAFHFAVMSFDERGRVEALLRYYG